MPNKSTTRKKNGRGKAEIVVMPTPSVAPKAVVRAPRSEVVRATPADDLEGQFRTFVLRLGLDRVDAILGDLRSPRAAARAFQRLPGGTPKPLIVMEEAVFGAKAAFVRSRPEVSAVALVREAEALGISLTPNHVYNIRAGDKKKAGEGDKKKVVEVKPSKKGARKGASASAS